MNDEFRSSRSEQRSKRRKTNLILNGLIAIVLILIIVISYNIFLGGNSKNESQKENKVEQKQDVNKEQKEEKNDSVETSSNSEETTSDVPSDIENNDSKQTGNSANGTEENSEKTTVNPDWQPVGTTQTGEHTAVYDTNSQDWKEMLKALSYATNVDEGSMTVLFLGNNGPNKSVGTVLDKTQQKKYKVYIEWVDGAGWKPTKVESVN
ncbi:YrrS family protein [Cytobacillus sp. Hz8]|uniref:YrrS family protein n=1 Tax=Cytobacillus sp. Hz8 TaxID=3347168 RepID=UPI0035D924EB